jgi:DNA-binding response OmpR family regulator
MAGRHRLEMSPNETGQNTLETMKRIKTLLIIDDDPVFCSWCAEELGDDGYRTICTSDGADVMEMIRRRDPDLVVLDIRLGEYDGLDLLQEIRNERGNLPVILHSAYETFQHDLRSIAANHYVVKSADLSELKHKVDTSFQAIPDYGPRLAAGPQTDQKAGYHGL